MLQRKDSLSSLASQSHDVLHTPVQIQTEHVEAANKSIVSNFIEAIDEIGSENEHSYLLNAAESKVIGRKASEEESKIRVGDVKSQRLYKEVEGFKDSSDKSQEKIDKRRNTSHIKQEKPVPCVVSKSPIVRSTKKEVRVPLSSVPVLGQKHLLDERFKKP